MSEQLTERGKDLVKYMPQAVNALADRLIEKLTERVLYGEKPQTNADRIRAMTDEELANLLHDHSCSLCPPNYKCDGRVEVGRKKCKEYWLRWLKSPVEVDE